MELLNIEVGVVEILYTTLLVFWIIYLYFVKNYGYWEEREVPHVPAVFPFGSMRETVLGRSFWGTAFDKIYKEYKDERYVGFTDIRRPCLLIRDPELIGLILKKDFSHFTDHSFLDSHPKDYMMNNLFNMKGQTWRDMRSKLSPAYTAVKMKMMFGLVKKCSDVLREELYKMTNENNAIDVKDVVSRFTIDIIASCAFGIETNSLKNKQSEFYQIGRDVMILDFTSLLKMYVYSAFPIFQKIHCFDFLDRKNTEFLTGMIRSTVEYRERCNVTRCDFLELLIKLRQNQSILEEGEKPDEGEEISTSKRREGLTIEEITSQTFLFFSAGFETAANTVVFSLYELACNSKIQDKLYSEVEEVLSRHKGAISYQALQEMTYMDQIVSETMRCYPVFPELTRTCTKTYTIPNSSLVVEKGLRIIIPIYSLHHDPKYFPDPYTFDPERFSLENCKKRQPSVFLPFGEGPRMCIGIRFGLMKIKTSIATLISDYEISITPDTDVPLKIRSNSFTTLPSKPLILVFNRRQHRL